MFNSVAKTLRPTFALFKCLRTVRINTNVNKYRAVVTSINVPGTVNSWKRSCSTQAASENIVSSTVFETACSETLESLAEYIEDLVENTPHLKATDINYGDGVLTIQFGKPFGTYVINRQSPNRQIWLSSPTSGPKRYDFVTTNNRDGHWMYKHDGVGLHQLLNNEMREIFKTSVDFSKCAYAV